MPYAPRSSSAPLAARRPGNQQQQQQQQEDKALFAQAKPHLGDTLFPMRWLQVWASRRLRSKRHFRREPQATLCVDGLVFGESPRVHGAWLYFVDVHGHQVKKYDPLTKSTQVVVSVDDAVSGIGFLPDGRLLIVCVTKRSLVVYDEREATLDEYADLVHCTRGGANDMVVAPDGTAYVGNYGFDLATAKPKDFCTTTMVQVKPPPLFESDGSAPTVSVAATGLFFPNGSVLTPDGKTLIVAETFGRCLTAFDVQADGSLANRRVWAHLGVFPDGICLDAEGCVWVAVPQVGIYATCGGLLRVQQGGKILDVVGFGQNGLTRSVFACALGYDADHKPVLYVVEARTVVEKKIFQHGAARAHRNGRLKAIAVAVGPARSAAHPHYSGGYC